MKLYEFFGSMSPLDTPQTNQEQGKPSKEEENKLRDDIFFHIIDHDTLHKRHFYEVVETIAHDKDSEKSVWLKLANDGCMDYYHTHKLSEDPKDVFSKKFREELCELLDDHYRKDILDGEYKLKK